MTTKSRLFRLLYCALTGFTILLVVYWLRNPNPNLIGRLPFAIMVSGLAALLAWPVSKLTHWPLWLVYLLTFIACVVAQAGLRLL